MKIVKNEINYAQSVSKTLNSLRLENEEIRVFSYFSNVLISLDAIMKEYNFILWKHREYDMQISTSDFNEEYVTFEVYTDRGMRVGEQFEKNDPLKREIKIYDNREENNSSIETIKKEEEE